MVYMKLDMSDFNKKMTGLLEYAEGFLETLKGAEAEASASTADIAIESAYVFVDSMARMYPERLHHVYEWGRAGVPDARLFKLTKIQAGKAIEIKSTFLQEMLPSPGSKQVFHNKAATMEAGRPLTIRPVNSEFLVFEGDAGTIFTKSPVTVPHPGGMAVAGAFANTMGNFQLHFENTYMRVTLVEKVRKIGHFFKPSTKIMTKSGGRAAAIKFLDSIK